MNEFDAVLAWVLSIVGGGADCGICNLLNNTFDNLLNQGIGVAGAAGAGVGTVVSGTTSVVNRVGDAARDARDAFNENYDRASGGADSSTTPSAPGTVQGPFGPVPAPRTVQGPFGPMPAPPPRNSWPGFTSPPSPTGMPQGTIKYFNVGTPTGSQVGGQQ